MPGDEPPERVAVTHTLQMAGHAADHQSVHHQHKHGAHAGQQTAGERPQRDADVVHHVEAEHRQIVAALAAQFSL